MTSSALLVGLLAIGLLRSPVCVQGFSLLGELAVSKPNTVGWWIVPAASDPRDRYSLLVDTVNTAPLSRDLTYVFRQVGRYTDDLTKLQREQISGNFQYPRNIAQTPANVFPSLNTVTQCDGSSIAGKLRGSVYITEITDLSNPIVYDIASNVQSPAYAYQNVVWMDANRDDRVDAFTCRISYEDPNVSQFVYLQQPPLAPLTLKWNDTVLATDTCDSVIARAQLSVMVDSTPRTYDVIFTAGYNTKDLSVYWTNSAVGRWDDVSQIGHRTILTGKAVFDVQVWDINNDGRLELLVSIRDSTDGSFEIFEIPSDFMTGVYISHVVMSRIGATGAARSAPGQIRVFHPLTSETNKKYWLLLAGADQGTAYYFHPVSESVDDWTWLPVEIVNHGLTGVVSGVEAADVDNDGYTELIVSVQNRDIIQIYTLK